MKTIQKSTILAILILHFSIFLLAQKTWTGNTSDNWNTASNWNPNGIPGNTDDVTIPVAEIDPVIKAGTNAVAKSVTVQSGAKWTIEEEAQIVVRDTPGTGVTNDGTIENRGSILIDKTSIGFWNKSGTFNNLDNGVVQIGSPVKVGAHGIQNGTSTTAGTINNAAQITIVQAEGNGIYNLKGTLDNNTLGISSIDIGFVKTIGGYGIDNLGIFHNRGFIHIDNTSQVGIHHLGGTFKNFANALISIGQTNPILMDGIYTAALFTNEGLVDISQTTGNGISNHNTFNNNAGAYLSIGKYGSVSNYGIENIGTFNNHHEITIDRALVGVQNTGGTFSNLNGSSLAIGQDVSLILDGISNAAIFKNLGSIKIDNVGLDGIYNSAGSFDNDATIYIGTKGASGNINNIGISNYATFLNSHYVNIDHTTSNGVYNSIGGFYNENNGFLNIGKGGHIGGDGIFNQDAFTNEGEIDIEDVALNGIVNNGGFFENSGAAGANFVNKDKIYLDKIFRIGIINEAGSTFDNKGNGWIGVGTSDPVSNEGVFNAGELINRGILFMEKTNGTSVLNEGTLRNKGNASLIVGANKLPGNGIINKDMLINNGVIGILQSAKDGIDNDGGTLKNQGTNAVIDIADTQGFISEIGIKNNGNVINKAIIAIAQINQTGIHNLPNGIFENKAGASIEFGGPQGQRHIKEEGILNENTFDNAGDITIRGIDKEGILNKKGNFFNQTGANINFFFGTVGNGIENRDLFKNFGTIDMSDNTVTIQQSGILNSIDIFGSISQAVFENHGTLKIGYTNNHGITNLFGGTFSNFVGGSITLGNSNSMIQESGIFNLLSFDNHGEINIDKVKKDGIHNTGTFANQSTAQLNIHPVVNLGENAIDNSGDFSNFGCADMTIHDNLKNTNSFINTGFFTLNSTKAHQTSAGNLTNNGAIIHLQNNPFSGGVVNNDVILNPLSGECEIANAVQVGGMNNFTIPQQWFSDQTFSQLVGTFDQLSNLFTFDGNISEGYYNGNFFLDDIANNCSRLIQLPVSYDDVTPPFLVCQDITIQLDPQGNATLNPNHLAQTVQDNCGAPTLSVPFTNLNCNDRGSNSINLTADDGNGNHNQCNSQVTVNGASLSIDDVSKNEGTGSGYTFYFFKATRNINPCFDYVDYSTSDGTATLADNDYVSANGTSYFPPNGSLYSYIIVRGVKDAMPESDEVFNVNLSNPLAGTLLLDAQGDATLINDDLESLVSGGNGRQNAGISSTANNLEILLYPNPASSNLNIQTPSDWFKDGSVEVALIDATGKTISGFQLEENQAVVNVSSLPEGVYTLSFQLENGQIFTERFLRINN